MLRLGHNTRGEERLESCPAGKDLGALVNRSREVIVPLCTSNVVFRFGALTARRRWSCWSVCREEVLVSFLR